jgi:tetratricopeptide (TPR) repeat protein
MKKMALLLCTTVLLVQLATAQTKKKVIAAAPKAITIEQLKTTINESYANNAYAKTIVLCNQLLTRTPNDTFNTVTKLLCLAKLKKHVEAIAGIKKFYKTNAADFLTEFPTDVYAAEFKERIKPEERELYYTEAQKLAPGNARVYFNNALEYIDDNNCTKAMALAEKGYPLINTETISFTRTYVFIQKKCGNKEKAWTILSEYTNKYPDDLSAAVLKGYFLSDQKKYAEALVYVNEVIALKPEEINLYLLRASIYFKMDDKAAACKEAKLIKEKFKDETAAKEFECKE